MDFPDIDRLTIFADNLVPHVLRLDGVLVYSDELAHAVDAGCELPAGGEFERELRGCAVHACELLATRLGVPARALDNWLWNRGQHPPYSERPAHITKTVFSRGALLGRRPVTRPDLTVGRRDRGHASAIARRRFASHGGTVESRPRRRQPARSRLIERHMPLARSLAVQYRHAREPLEDLCQVANVGLVKAVDRYDPARGIAFTSFAVPTILGELKRHFRDRTWTIHISRGSQEAIARVEKVSEGMRQELGRYPSVSEVAPATG